MGNASFKEEIEYLSEGGKRTYHYPYGDVTAQYSINEIENLFKVHFIIETDNGSKIVVTRNFDGSS